MNHSFIKSDVKYNCTHTIKIELEFLFSPQVKRKKPGVSFEASMEID